MPSAIRIAPPRRRAGRAPALQRLPDLPFASVARSLPARALILCSVALLAACSNQLARFDPQLVPPLQYGAQVYTVADAMAAEPSRNLLEVSDEMRAFVDQYARGIHNQRNRVMSLHTAVKSPAALDMQYDPFADGSASETFNSGAANCLSYAHLFIALAREAGLKARYNWMDVRPEWQRIGERVAVRLHVNVLVETRDGDEFMIDIDPLRRHEVAGSHVITDTEAAALFHSNRSMQRLAEDDAVGAWFDLVQALRLAPRMSHIWVNLGAVYRHAEQYAEAEQAYFQALSIDRTDRSAMNNLVVLYELTGRQEEEAYWADRLVRYRERNPYYHSQQGDIAARAGDWDAAFAHYKKATKLQPRDSELVYGLAIIEHRRGNYDAAERLIERAIEVANFETDEQNYRIQLKNLKAERAASL